MRTLLLLVVSCGFSPLLAGDKTAEVKGWGKIVDPVGDCEFKEKDGKLTLKVPGTYHDFTPLPGYMNNAARIYQEVEGDFAVEVRCSGTVLPDKGKELPGKNLSFRAGTLLIWQDSNNFVRLDRGGMVKDGKDYFTVYCHVFSGGKRLYERAPFAKDEPAILRLERKGNKIHASARQSPGTITFPVQTVNLPAKVQVCLGGINASTQPLEVHFEELKITR